jgi:hypothetical protein
VLRSLVKTMLGPLEGPPQILLSTARDKVYFRNRVFAVQTCRPGGEDKIPNVVQTAVQRWEVRVRGPR